MEEVKNRTSENTYRRRVDVIIPTYKPGKKFSRLLKMLERQTYPIGSMRESTIFRSITCKRLSLTTGPPGTGAHATAGRISWYS